MHNIQDKSTSVIVVVPNEISNACVMIARSSDNNVR